MALNLSTAFCAATAFLCGSTASQNKLHKLTQRKTELGRLVTELFRLETKKDWKEMRLEMRLEMKEMRLEIKSELMDMKTELLAAIRAITGPEKATKPRAAEATENQNDGLKEPDEEIQWLELVTLQLRFEIIRKELEIAEMDGSEQDKIDDIKSEVVASRTDVEDANAVVLSLKGGEIQHLERYAQHYARESHAQGIKLNAQGTMKLPPQEYGRWAKLKREIFWVDQDIDERGVYKVM